MPKFSYPRSLNRVMITKLNVILWIQKPGVNLTNILRAAFTCADPKSAIKLLNMTVFFALLGSARVKAARRTLVKLNPGVDGTKSIFNMFSDAKLVQTRKFIEYICKKLSFTLTCLTFARHFYIKEELKIISFFPMSQSYKTQLASLYLRFRWYLGKSFEIIIFRFLFTTFEWALIFI